jgi:hypothetical protein
MITKLIKGYSGVTCRANIPYYSDIQDKATRKGPARGIGKEPRISSYCKTNRYHSTCPMLQCSCWCHDRYRIK